MNADVDHFLYTASHDLKAPLRAVENLAQWIEEDLGPDAKPEVAENLRLMRQRVRRMSRLLDDLLEFSRAGEPEEAREVDLGELALEAAKGLPSRPGIALEIAPGAPRIAAAPKALGQALRHLIGNAYKHHDKERGTVRVSARDLGGSCEIEVADDGPGIDPRHHEKVFQLFHTLKPKDEAEGSGLGLALVKKIAEARGGALRLESEPGRGSRFLLTWPKGA